MSDRTKNLEQAATTLCIKLDRNPSSERAEEIPSRLPITSTATKTQVEELLEDACTKHLQHKIESFPERRHS